MSYRFLYLIFISFLFVSNASMQVQIVNHLAISKELGLVDYDHSFTSALNCLEELFFVDESLLRALYVREKFWHGDVILLYDKASLQRALADLLKFMVVCCPSSFSFNNHRQVEFFIKLENLIDCVYLRYPSMFNRAAIKSLRALVAQGDCLMNPYTTSFAGGDNVYRAIAFCSSFDAVKRDSSTLDCVIEHGENICACLTDVFKLLFQIDE